jgi:hypothetical protein
MRKLLAFALIAGLVPAVRAEEKPDARPVKVPFILTSSGHFIVKTTINDKGPYLLIFDTGAPTMLVSTKLAKDAGLTMKKSGGLFAMGAAAQVAKTFEIGGLKAENVGMMVFDHPTVRAFSEHYRKEHGPIEGIVGFPFFARYKMIVDYQAKELTLTPNGYQPGDVMEALMAKMMGGSKDQGKPKIAAPAGVWGLEVRKDAKDDEEGVVIAHVLAGGPADLAGLKAGDRLLTIGNRWTDSVADAYLAASHAKPGQKTSVTLKRDGKEKTLAVVPAVGL